MAYSVSTADVCPVPLKPMLRSLCIPADRISVHESYMLYTFDLVFVAIFRLMFDVLDEMLCPLMFNRLVYVKHTYE